MNKLTITIEITDPKKLKWLAHYNTDELVQAFVDTPEAWLDGAEIEVAKE